MTNELGDHRNKGVFFFAFLGDDDGAVGEELETYFAKATQPAEARRVVGSSTPLISAMAVTGPLCGMTNDGTPNAELGHIADQLR